MEKYETLKFYGAINIRHLCLSNNLFMQGSQHIVVDTCTDIFETFLPTTEMRN